MVNLVYISSIIDPPNHIPYSWQRETKEPRSRYSKNERFEQTKKTINTVKEKIPNCKIILVECSKLFSNENNYFINNVDYFINLFDIKDYDYIYKYIYGDKGYGERNMTIEVINYINENNIIFDNFFKVSGRYFINDNFNYEIYNNDKNVFLCSCNYTWCTTYIYKLNKSGLEKLLKFLIDHEEHFIVVTAMEKLYSMFAIDLYNNGTRDTLIINAEINNFNDGITQM